MTATGGASPAAGTVPALVSRRSGLVLPLVLFVGAGAVFAVVALVGLVLFTGSPGHAEVLGPVPGTDQVSIAVLDGPDPKAWRVPASDAGDAQTGDVIEVRLGGDCDCVPYPATGSPVGLVTACLLMLVFFGLVLRSYLRSRKGAAAQAKARRLLTPDASVTPVRLRMSVGARRTRVWARADLIAEDGTVLGALDLGALHPDFDPHGGWWLVGGPLIGSPVALVSEGRTQVILPSSLLEPPVPAAPWSATAVGIIGWADTPDRVVPVLPSQGRVVVGDGGPDDVAETEALLAERRELVRRLQYGIFAVLGVAFVLVLVGVPVYVAFLIGLGGITLVNIVGSRTMRRRSTSALDLDADERPYLQEIGTCVATWRVSSRRAPAFTRPLPVAAV